MDRAHKNMTIESSDELSAAIQAQAEELSEIKGLLRTLIDCTSGVIHTLRHENRLLLTQIRVQSLHNDIVEFWYEGELIRFFVPDADTDLIQRDLVMWKTFFEIDFLERIRKRYSLSGATVLDAGANIGNHTVFFAKACRAGKVISFEPNPQAADILERNVRLNNLMSTTVIKEGLSDNEGFIYFSSHSMANVGGTSFSHEGPGRGFKCRTIDSLNLPRLDFVKIDVEGMSKEVLTGGRETLAQHRPVVMVELFPHEFETGAGVLKDLGYSMVEQLNPDNFIFEHEG